MKIALCFFPKVGGSGIVGSQLALDLAKMGHEITVISYDTPFLLKQTRHQNISFETVDLVSYPLFSDIGTPFTILCASKLANVAKEKGIDIINVHYAIPGAVSAYLANKITNVPIAITAHGSDIHTLGIDPAYNSVIKHVLSDVNGLSTVSNYMKKVIQEKFDIKRDIKVIYNGIDVSKFRHIGVKECDFKKLYSNYFTHISNFRAVKNVPFIIEAFADILEKEKDIGLILVGDGPERKKSEQLTKELGIEDHVLFQGIRYSLTPIYSCSTALICASKNESFGLTLIEAMSCETPVIAPKVGGIPEVVEDDKTGFLYDYLNKQQLVDYMLYLLNDKNRAKKMGKEGRKRVLEKFNNKNIAEKYLEWYRRLIETVKV